MKKQIWKFGIIPSQKTIEMPKGAKVLSVQMQNDIPCIWVLVDPKADKTKRTFEIFGTGHDIECDGISREFIGTFQMHSGSLVFHLFERI